MSKKLLWAAVAALWLLVFNACGAVTSRPKLGQDTQLSQALDRQALPNSPAIAQPKRVF